MANAFWPPESDPLSHARAMLDNGRVRDAIAILKPLVENGRAGLLARSALAHALVVGGEIDDALMIARETTQLYPDAAAAALGLGEALLAGGLPATAIAEIQRSLRIDPDLRDARVMLGRAWLEAGEPEKALQALDAVAERTQETGDLIKRARNVQSLSRSNPAYVRHLFDQFAADYDARMLGHLSYEAPRILRELAALVLPGAKALNVLDLGCGTGLAGEAFRDITVRLDGIDLSPSMVSKARARRVYDALWVGDLETGLPGKPEYDLAIAADTLVYLGDLEPVFVSVAAALKSGGAFLFTVEKLDGESYALGPKRRWQHTGQYLREQAENAGFDVAALMECSPRSEAGVAVPGLAAALLKR